MDEFETGKGADCRRDFLEECIALDLASNAKAGGDGIERGVVIAGMADEFPCALGHGVEDLVKRSCVKPAGGGDADRPISRADVTVAELRQ
jgi:hypothetical protein